MYAINRSFKSRAAFTRSGCTGPIRPRRRRRRCPAGRPGQYVVRLRKAGEKRPDLVSFGAASAADMDTLAEQLLAGGVQLISQPGKVDTPGGGYGFRFFDVDGRTVEVSADVEVRQHRRIEEKEPIPVKLSHVVLDSPHVGDVTHFMRISNQHHSMDIAKGPHTSLRAGPAHGGRQHLHLLLLPRPARQLRRVHDGVEGTGRGHPAPARLRLLAAQGQRPGRTSSPPTNWRSTATRTASCASR